LIIITHCSDARNRPHASHVEMCLIDGYIHIYTYTHIHIHTNLYIYIYSCTYIHVVTC
jgi:hypothetical protein